MARVLLGVTGGIAAYKALELTRLATKAGHSVRVIQTEASTRFVGTASFAAITGAPVLVTEWEPDALRGAWPSRRRNSRRRANFSTASSTTVLTWRLHGCRRL